MDKWEIQMLMLRKVNTREGFQVLNLPQKFIRNTRSVPILQVGRLRWGMAGLDWGSVNEQPLEVGTLDAVDAELGVWDTPPLHKGEQRERERDITSDGVFRRQPFLLHPSSSSSLQVRLENWYLQQWAHSYVKLLRAFWQYVFGLW